MERKFTTYSYGVQSKAIADCKVLYRATRSCCLDSDSHGINPNTVDLVPAIITTSAAEYPLFYRFCLCPICWFDDSDVPLIL